MNPEPDNQAARIYLLPNLMTAGNLFCGFAAVLNILDAVIQMNAGLSPAGQIHTAIWFILGACVFDLLDGRLARLGGNESAFGREFDSLADIVSFGVAPALMACFLIINPGVNDDIKLVTWLFAFIYLLCVGVRLARFNVLTNPLIPGNEKRAAGGDFVGLPSPAAAGMMASLVLVLSKIMVTSGVKPEAIASWSWTLLPLMLIISYLMVSNVRFPSFKKVDWNTKTRSRGFILIIMLTVAAYRYREFALPAVFLGYICWGVVRHFFLLRKGEIDPAPEDEDENEPTV